MDKFKLCHFRTAIEWLIIVLIAAWLLTGCETMPPFVCESADADTCAILASLHRIEWNTAQAADAAAYGAMQQAMRPYPVYPIHTAPPLPAPVMAPVWEWVP